MQKTILLILMLSATLFTFGQTQKGTILLSILNEQNKPLENVTIELLRHKDSALVKIALSDKSGAAVLKRYLLEQHR